MSFAHSFVFNNTATTETYTLSLHDALPICLTGGPDFHLVVIHAAAGNQREAHGKRQASLRALNRVTHQLARSEEHTSELQSQSNLVCRLLLEKKKNTI